MTSTQLTQRTAPPTQVSMHESYAATPSVQTSTPSVPGVPSVPTSRAPAVLPVAASTIAILAGAAATGLSLFAILVLLVSDSEIGFRFGVSLFVLGVGIGVGAAAMVGGLVLKRLS